MHEDIRKNLFLLNPDAGLVESVDRVLDRGSVFSSSNNDCPVKDTKGNGLMRDAKYRLNGELVRIKDWQFGSGNLLNRYYWVWYIDSNLSDQRVTIEARYPNGVFGGPEYSSEFIPV